MKSNDNKVLIYVRKLKNGKFIYLRKAVIINGTKVDKRVGTHAPATAENLKYYRENGYEEFQKLLGIQQHETVIFSDFLPIALKVMNADANEETSEDRVQKIRDYILPTFGKCDISLIEPSFIEDWQIELKQKKGSHLTKRCKGLLSSIFKRAVVHKLIPFNPCTSTMPIKKDIGEGNEREIYSKEEISKMIQGSEGWLRAFIMVFCYIGARSSEVIGLQWSDIDWDNRKVTIQRGIRKRKIKLPKRGVRTVDLPLALCEELAKLKQNSGSVWVFPAEHGSNYKDCSSIVRRHFKPLLERLGIRYRTLYSLKHSYASHLLAGGQRIDYIAKQLGHCNIKHTFDFYIKFVETAEAKEKTDEILHY